MKISQLIGEYIGLKHSMEIDFRSPAGILKSFCAKTGDIEITKVKPATVKAFLDGKGNVTSFWHIKFQVLSNFYHFLIVRNYVKYSPLPKTIPKRPKAMTPYIYTIEELRRLISATDKLKNPLSPLRADTFRTLILTLYGTGLRIGEALSLTLTDVSFKESLIVVRNTKFFKTRWVPIGPCLKAILQNYVQERRKLPCPKGKDSGLFATRSGNALTYDCARKVFPMLRKAAGICREARYQPRIHDIRHTATTHRLLAWYRQGADVQSLLPKLSTYLGHVNISSTQRYLSMIPELAKEASYRFEEYALKEGGSHE